MTFKGNEAKTAHQLPVFLGGGCRPGDFGGAGGLWPGSSRAMLVASRERRARTVTAGGGLSDGRDSL